MESSQAKNQALMDVGVVVPTSYEAFEAAIKETFEKLVEQWKITPVKEVKPPQIPEDLNTAIKSGKVRMKKKGIIVPGIGHMIKRVELLQRFARTHFPSVKYMEYAVQVETYTLSKANNLVLNVDGAIGSLFLDLLAGSGMFTKQEIDEIVEIGVTTCFFSLQHSHFSESLVFFILEGLSQLQVMFITGQVENRLGNTSYLPGRSQVGYRSSSDPQFSGPTRVHVNISSDSSRFQIATTKSQLMAFSSQRDSSLLLAQVSCARFICSSSSSFPREHISFIKEVTATQPPEHLCQLLGILNARGESILSPRAKQGLMPLAIPLWKNSSGTITALLRWPTAPIGMEMPVVEVCKHGVWLLAKNFFAMPAYLPYIVFISLSLKSVDQFIHRILVNEDANSCQFRDELFHAASDAGDKFYKRGDFSKSGITDIDVYLLRKVSALVTGEFYTGKEHFPGFARPFVFNAQLLQKVGRNLEAKDTARGALKSPWWTLGCKYHEVARVAEWEDEQIEYRNKKLTEESRIEDLNRGKPPFQIALDEAAFLLDLTSVEETWDNSLEQIADCYKEAGLHDMARFVQYKD
ncbi:hypothetical protein F3Y22_tig00014064pilonHSYRG00099 [Hibiscus syriacus]|uniref:Uncharacterized protein n=1 Tax=Hibiscus syriacus TaxID=106335 RepID=A0A6A3C254_HIBSY|nr:hypothetical protein F3Y22_tig00014064pilonHSYRG00099 [Hibiscus syriacus]